MARNGDYTTRVVENRGRRDGRSWRWSFFPFKWPFQIPVDQDPPLDNEDCSAFEGELRQGANVALGAIKEEWFKLDRELASRCMTIEDAVVRAKAEVDKEKQHAAGADYVVVAAEQSLSEASISPPQIKASYHAILLSLLVMAEGAFNYMVFKMFGQDKLETTLMAIGLVISIPVVTEFIGYKLKQSQKTLTDKLLMTGAGISFVALLYTISYLREKFFHFQNVIGKEVLSESVDQILSERVGFKWHANEMMLVFYILNVTFVLAGLVLAYQSTRSTSSKYRKLKHAIDSAKKKYAEENSSLVHAEINHAKVLEEFNEAHTVRTRTFEGIKAKAAKIKDLWIHLITMYRAANMDVRVKKELPKSFLALPETIIIIPKKLTGQLDCGQCNHHEKEKTMEKTEEAVDQVNAVIGETT